MYNEEFHAEFSLDTVWVIIQGRRSSQDKKQTRKGVQKNFGRKTRRKVKSLDN